MTNLYKAPISDVSLQGELIISKTIWKVLFWICLLLELFFYLSDLLLFLFMPEQTVSDEAWSYTIDVILSCLLMTAFFGFSYNKRILSNKLWKFLIVFSVLWYLYVLSDLRYDFSELEGGVFYTSLAFILLAWLLIIPQYWALYNYCYRSSNIWKTK